ncbi:MAG: methylated-DNA--[protein]-cysteine S-methyltransferase [Candidatus Limnocylindrales bacterium]
MTAPETTLPELGARRAPAPTDLAPTVLIRVGLADEWFMADAPLGPIFVAYNGRGISATGHGERPDGADGFEAGFADRFGRAIRPARGPDAHVVRAVARSLADGRPRGLAFDLRGTTPFAASVLRGALTIPRGEIRPYAWLAREIGRPAAVRAVGSALGHNPVPILIPCHRIVRSDGHIGDYAWGSNVKRAALAAEGLDPDAFERAARAGSRYLGSDTTHIVCLPTCWHARRIMARHRVAFGSLGEAGAAGYRPCKTCRPA